MSTHLPDLLEGRAYRVRPNRHANHTVTIEAATVVSDLTAHRVRCECGDVWVVEDLALFVALSEDEVEDAAVHKRDS